MIKQISGFHPQHSPAILNLAGKGIWNAGALSYLIPVIAEYRMCPWLFSCVNFLLRGKSPCYSLCDLSDE